MSSDTIKKSLQAAYGVDSARYIYHSSYNNYEYTKTEYEHGQKVEGTHQEYQEGMSLLVIGYKSSIGVKVKNTRTNVESSAASGAVPLYPPRGDSKPLYTITGIKTTSSDPTGSATTNKKTTLTIEATALTKEEFGVVKKSLTISNEPFWVKGLVNKIGEDGEPTEELVEEWIEISEDENSPTEVTFRAADGNIYTYTIWAERGASALENREAIFHLAEVPVNIALPDIQLLGQLNDNLADNDQYSLQVTIQGKEDSRAISAVNGNMAETAIAISLTEATSLRKQVDRKLIEQDGEFSYDVSYTNDADTKMEKRLYLYDLMPYNDDDRGSDFEVPEGEETAENKAAQVQSIRAEVSGGTTEKDTVAHIYYSTIIQSALKSYVDFGEVQEGQGELSTTGQDIEQLIRNGLLGNDGRGVYYIVDTTENEETRVPVDIYEYDDEGRVVGVNDKIVEYNRNGPYGTVTIKEGMQGQYAFWCVRYPKGYYQAGNTVTGEGNVTGEVNLVLYKLFRYLGDIHPYSGDSELETGDDDFLNFASCVYGLVDNLGGGSTISLKMKLKTRGNLAGNRYGNIAHSWKAGDNRTNGTLVSNEVRTFVISRELSGVVWEDSNQNGIQDEWETTLKDVTCTLFRWDEKDQEYKPCSIGPNGRLIEAGFETDSDDSETTDPGDPGNSGDPDVSGDPEDTGDPGDPDDSNPPEGDQEDEGISMVTGADGAYRFRNLAAGDYVVAFSGSGLLPEDKEYRVTTHQVNGVNDENTNDSIAMDKDLFPGIDSEKYLYCLHYGAVEDTGITRSRTGNEAVTMDTLADLEVHSERLTHWVQRMDHQDLGVTWGDPILPKTGGRGTYPYQGGGMLLIALSFLLGIAKRRRDQSDDQQAA